MSPHPDLVEVLVEAVDGDGPMASSSMAPSSVPQ
jgi:hypothetical protein